MTTLMPQTAWALTQDTDGNNTTDQYTITVTSADENMGTVSGSGTYDNNSQQTIKATPKEHYHFVQWNDNNTDNPRTITVTGEATYTATFAIDQHSISVISDDENKGTVSGSGIYSYNSQITITATHQTGYHFVKWNDDNTDASRQITVTEAATYTAYFAPNQYTISTESNNADWGTVTGGGTYDYNTQHVLTATSGSNLYHFKKWSDGNTDNPRTITVTEAATYTATYEYVYTITNNTLTGVASWAEGALEVPDGVVAISADAFNGCAVTAVTIPATVTTIAEHAFNGCNSLTDITFAPGSRCKSIGADAVYNTTARPSLHLTSLPKMGNQYFLTVASLALTDNSYVSTVDGEFSYVTFPEKGTRTYTRQMTNEWGTAVLPFTVGTNSEVQLYSIVSISCPTDENEEEETELAGTIILSAVSDTIQANRPFVFRKKNPNATSVIFTDSKNLRAFIPHKEENSFTIEEVGVKLVGTYIVKDLDACQGENEETECTSTNYFIAQNAFGRADDGVTILPFRAWFDFSNYTGCGQGNNEEDEAPARFIIAEANDNNPPIATGLSGTDSSTSKGEPERGSKVLINGQLFYLREGKMFNINGLVVK